MLNTAFEGFTPTPQDMEYLLRLATAVVLGGLIGLERELHDKPAGFRTIILISVGACVFTILSQLVGGPDWNSTRIAAQIVTGIGFLGAGAILRDRHSVLGLTTAATIWAVAAVGMAVGFGHYVFGTFGAVTILVVLFAFDVVEDWIGDLRDVQEYDFSIAKTDDVMERVSAVFAKAKLHTKKRHCYEEGDLLVFRIVAMGAKTNHDTLRLTLAQSNEYKLRRS